MSRTYSPGIRPRPRFVMPVADLPDLTPDDSFSRGPARRPEPLVRDPLMQWSTGLPTRERAIYAGWLIGQGQDAALDAALEQAGVLSATIRHSGGTLVDHWTLPTASLFVVTAGIQTLDELRDASERYGVSLGWRQREDGRQQSVVRARVFVRELLHAGYEQPCLISLKGTLTGDLISALVCQYRVLDAAATLIGRADLPFYAFSVPIGPGNEVTRGSGPQTREIVPPVALIPDPIDQDYLATHWTRQGWADRIESLLDATIAWSLVDSARIANGGGA